MKQDQNVTTARNTSKFLQVNLLKISLERESMIVNRN